MTERLLQYIWQFQYFNRSALQTSEGEDIQVIFPGSLNKDQGPDFQNAKIKIDNMLMAGTVEVHCKASEWKSHQHDTDKKLPQCYFTRCV